LIQPAQLTEIEIKKKPKKWPNYPFSTLLQPVTPKIEDLEEKVCAIKYSFTSKEQNI